MRAKGVIWLALDNLIGFFAGNLQRILNFFIWEESKSLQVILEFNFYWVIFSGFGSLLAGLVSTLLGPKITYLIARLLKATTAVVAFTQLENISDYIILIAALEGLSNAFLIASRSVLDLNLFGPHGLQGITSFRSVFSALISIIRPLVITALIVVLGYEQAFLISLSILFFLSIFIIPFRQENKVKQSFELPSMMREFFSNPLRWKVARISFASGVGYVFSLGLLDIIIVEKIGSLEGWGTITTLMAIVGMFVAAILRKFDTVHLHKVAAILGITTMAYAIAPLFLINDFSQDLLVIFLLAQAIYFNANGIIGLSVVIETESYLPDAKEHKAASQAFRDIFYSLGLFTPIALMRLAPESWLTPDYLLIALAICTLFPFLNHRLYRTIQWI